MNKNQQRQKLIARVRQLLLKRPVYLDTETTGTHRSAEVVEICIVDDAGQVLLDSLVKPLHKIPRNVMQVHGITNTMVKTAPTWTDLWPQVESALTGRSIGIYNSEFDRRLIKQSHQQAKLTWQPLQATTFCIMKLYAEFYGERNHKRGGYRWHSLAKAGQQCGISLPNSHRAKADTLLSRAILHYMGQP